MTEEAVREPAEPTLAERQAARHAELRRRAETPNDSYMAKLRQQHKLTVRERLEKLLDPGSFVEDGLYANVLAEGLPADGVVTGVGRIQGRPVCVMANDPTVKAGSWGARTVEKIVRVQETAARLLIPILYLVDSAGARITDQVDMFPGRRHAGRIFHNEIGLSGRVPQICLLFGPSAAGGAYIPAFCDVVAMVEGNASMYLGSPRMAEVVVGEKVSLEELGGARMHCTVSGCGDFLVQDDEAAIELLQAYIGYFPQSFREEPPTVGRREVSTTAKPIPEVLPAEPNRGYDMRRVIEAIVDEGSWLEVKKLYAKELLTGLARLDGHPVGIVANQPMQKGGVLFPDSSDKAARFVWLCDAFNIPLLFLADVPGFMIGTAVERAGIIRSGAKMVSAVSEASVPKISVIVRKAYGAGLYAMCGPAYDPDCTLALPSAQIAVMGPEAAINAVYANKLEGLEEPERTTRRRELEAEYAKDVDLYKLAANLVVDHVVEPENLRAELIRRFELYSTRFRVRPDRKHGVYPV
ncbi:MAG TPA: acyl-CoA carboxylase subunit beta [Candidatus Dormibacteraeota bacterium]|jgi:acetyl-CoA carboxylase carboxyltransferase component|nr:acyl-CoA carboxylase subunit beta [Candidatus Dormibacteraeota bacterium]